MQAVDRLAGLGKEIVVPVEIFEKTLERLDWTWHQCGRGEFPAPFRSLEEFQLAIICSDRLLWCQAFLREPTDPDSGAPYNFFPYQIESLKCSTCVVHQDGAEVGKTREIVALALYFAFNYPNGSGFIGAPLQIHLDEIIDAMMEQMHTFNPALGKSLVKHKKQPYHQFTFANRFKIDFRPAGFDGNAYRGVHAETFGFVDEAAKKKNRPQWTEFWRALKPSATARIYSVPDGDRESEYYKLTMRASGKTDDNDKTGGDNYSWTLFRWGKDLMPPPFWTPERKRSFVELYGGEDSPGYRHNVRGEHGDPENTVFPWNQLRHCIRDIPEYRCLKVLVDSGRNEVIIEGYRCEYEVGADGPVPRHTILHEETANSVMFFELDGDGDNEFRRLIRSFFQVVPGLRRGGGDLGFSQDPTEIYVKNIIGKRERLVARLQLKQVTYDMQCQALDALDDLYGGAEQAAPLHWGTDFGNAGSAVAHDLQGLQQYAEKCYEDRLKGFMFQSTTDNIDDEGETITDAKTGKPSKITLKELATDLITKKMQRQLLEYPPDQDIIMAYTNHTCRAGERQRIYNKENDHLIDADRLQELAGVLGCDVEDLFACG